MAEKLLFVVMAGQLGLALLFIVVALCI